MCPAGCVQDTGVHGRGPPCTGVLLMAPNLVPADANRTGCVPPSEVCSSGAAEWLLLGAASQDGGQMSGSFWRGHPPPHPHSHPRGLSGFCLSCTNARRRPVSYCLPPEGQAASSISLGRDERLHPDKRQFVPWPLGRSDVPRERFLWRGGVGGHPHSSAPPPLLPGSEGCGTLGKKASRPSGCFCELGAGSHPPFLSEP